MIRIVSHGTKRRPAATRTIDCRYLPNPHDIPGLRPRDGRQTAVAEWVLDWPQTQSIINDTVATTEDGDTIAVMCSAGRHRSVAVAEAIGHQLEARGHTVTIDHLNLKPTKKPMKKTSDRGYGTAHQKLRARWKPQVEAGNVNCARCHQPIRPGTPWDLGHDDHNRSRYSGPEHRTCNRGEPSRRRTRPQPHSRRW